MFRFLCVVAFLSNSQLNLQGFLCLPYHRFLFHLGLLSEKHSYPIKNVVLVGRFVEIFQTASRCCFPDFTDFYEFSLRCRWQLRLPVDFFKIERVICSARVRSTVCISSSRNTRPLHASCCVAGSRTMGEPHSLVGSAALLSNQLPPLFVRTGHCFFEPFSRLFIVKDRPLLFHSFHHSNLYL